MSDFEPSPQLTHELNNDLSQLSGTKLTYDADASVLARDTFSVEECCSIESQALPPASAAILLAVSVLVVLCLAAAGFCWWLGHPLLIGSDQALYASMAQLFLEGRVPYVDMFDNNPPLAFYLQIPPVVIAQLGNIPLSLSFSMYVSALALLSSLLMLTLASKSRHWGAMLAILAATIAFAYFTQIQMLDFGQREHLFCILYMPFFIVRYLRWRGLKTDLWLALFCGVLAGIGIALKHYFLLIACAPELVWFLRQRLYKPFLAPEVRATALVVLLYLVHFVFLPKEELHSFFTFIVPIYKEGYNYYVTSALYNMGTFWRIEFYWMALVSLLALSLSRLGSLAPALCAFSVMSALVYVFAGQIWSYHMVPVRMANTMAFGVELVLLSALCCRRCFKKDWMGPLVKAAIAVIVCGASFYLYNLYHQTVGDLALAEPYSMKNLGYDGSCPAADIEPFVESCLAHSKPSDMVLFICSAMAPGYPLMVQTGRRPGSRFIHGMILPILSFIDERKDLSASQRAYFRQCQKTVLNWYAEDIKRYKPALIYVQDNPMKWVLEKDKFIEKKMDNYQFLNVQDGISIYKRRN